VLGRAACLLLCSAVVTACGSAVESSENALGTNGEPTVSTEVESCLPRGTELVSVAVLPQDESLSNAMINGIELQPGFGFAVTVANHGCAPESEVKIVLSADGTPMFAGEGEIDELNPGKEATVVIDNLPLPQLEEKLLLHVEIEPVPAEVNLDNNVADYPVIFLISGG
jgi:CARDB